MHPTWFSLSESLTPTSTTSGSIPPSFLSTPPGTSEAHDLLPGGSTLQPIPYHQMWEESRVWMPRLLQNLIHTPTPTPHTDLVPQEQKQEQEGTNNNNNNNKQYFIHHVQFVGGVDKDVSSDGEYSVWHGMGERRLDWVDEVPVMEWNLRRSFGRYP
ncbi:hypothetical protein AA313_de0202044 [Arthrobotrys entomopaga]|nr:hypothetical protein AA313_de0202044 [Arthrobotrys entomopaga]